MKRLEIHYGGFTYVTGAAEYEPIRSAIAEAHLSGNPTWLRVGFGEGRPQLAELLIHPGVPIALIPVDESD